MTSPDGFDSARWEARLDNQHRLKSGTEPQVSEEEAAAWAMMLAGSLPAQELHVPTLSLGLSSGQTTGNVGGSFGSSAPFGSHSPQLTSIVESQPADTSSVNHADEQRLILNVDSETLGRVQLIVDREEGGVRVLVGSAPEAKGRLSAGKHTLGEALSAAGVRVQSLRFVTQSEVGTVLAQHRSTRRTQDGSPKQDDPEEAPEREPRGKKKRNLNLVG